MALYAKVTCYPPLGQVSVVEAEQNNTVNVGESFQVPFTVVIEWSKSMPQFLWEVTLCYRQSLSPSPHRAEARKWLDCPLSRSEKQAVYFHKRHSEPLIQPLEDFRSTFTGLLPISLNPPLCFTIKYRVDSQSPWQWVETQFGTRNGLLLIQSLAPIIAIESFLHLEPHWLIKPLHSGRGHKATFQIISPFLVPAARRERAQNLHTVALGKIHNQVSFFALVRISEPWLAPRHGGSIIHLEEEAVLICFLNESGQSITMLAKNGLANLTSLLKSDDDGTITVTARNDDTEDKELFVIVAVDDTAENSIKAAVAGLQQIVQRESTAQLTGPEITLKSSIADLTANKSWHDGLAYCTYNSLGVDLTPKKILDGLNTLEENGLNISTLIIDDNWQSVDGHEGDGIWQLHRAWNDFEANKTHFPAGLKETLQEIRRRHPKIKDFAVWHALFGYWKGISPTGKLASRYDTMEVNASLMGHVTTHIQIIHPNNIHKFYDDFYTFLSTCGITSVKTDAQFMLDNLQSSLDRASVINTYQSAWTNAHTTHINTRAISCMSMIPQILFHSCSATNFPKITLRNSDDYFPEIPSSHALHVFINAHNALLTRNLNVIPDWDMFQTVHPYASFHAAARCISGGPILITDTPGEHDIELIKEMTAPSPTNGTVVLRPTRAGRAMEPFLSFNDGQVLKIKSFADYDTLSKADAGTAAVSLGGKGAAFIGLFNISEQPITFMINGSADFHTIETESEHLHSKPHNGASNSNSSTKEKQPKQWETIIQSHRSSQLFASSPAPVSSAIIHMTLPVRGWEILTEHRVQNLTLRTSSSKPLGNHGLSIKIAILGLLHKMTGVAAIKKCTLREGRVKVSLKAIGVFGIWSNINLADRLPRVWLQGKIIPARNARVVLSKTFEVAEGRVTEVDLFGAWEDMGLGPASKRKTTKRGG